MTHRSNSLAFGYGDVIMDTYVYMYRDHLYIAEYDGPTG